MMSLLTMSFFNCVVFLRVFSEYNQQQVNQSIINEQVSPCPMARREGRNAIKKSK